MVIEVNLSIESSEAQLACQENKQQREIKLKKNTLNETAASREKRDERLK